MFPIINFTVFSKLLLVKNYSNYPKTNNSKGFNYPRTIRNYPILSEIGEQGLNIKELAEEFTDLRRAYGNRLCGPCPWCGGNTCFTVDTAANTFKCWSCRKGGDRITLLREKKGMTYFEACHELGIEPKFKPAERKKKTWEPRKAILPSFQWRKPATAFVDDCAEALFSDAGRDMLRWLRDRGISERSARLARLGLNRQDRPGKPAGLAIPCHIDGEICRVRIRRFSGEGSKYHTLKDSIGAPLRFGHDRPAVVVVESDLDAVLVSQECGDLATVVSLGSCSTKPDKATDEELIGAEVVLLALDADKAGREQVPWWKKQYGDKIKVWPTPIGKDAGEAYQKGVSIRAWVMAGLPEKKNVIMPFPDSWKERFDEVQLERLAIMTVDGGLTDEQALEALGLT